MKKTLIIAAIFLIISVACGIGWWQVSRLSKQKAQYKRNTESLMDGIEKYKVLDSLNAAKVQSLELTIRDFKRLREEDAKLIKNLKTKASDLESVNKTQAQTIIRLSAIPRDTILIMDSIPIKAVAVHCGDAWYDFYGILTQDEFTGDLENRDSLVLVESIEYKRFLGFLWKTKQVKKREMNVLSKNPHTEIVGVEHIIIN